jgi:hypothetical protein
MPFLVHEEGQRREEAEMAGGTLRLTPGDEVANIEDEFTDALFCTGLHVFLERGKGRRERKRTAPDMEMRGCKGG